MKNKITNQYKIKNFSIFFFTKIRITTEDVEGPVPLNSSFPEI